MRHFAFITSFALLLPLSQLAAALSLGPEEFAASKTMACVLAQESLGQLSDVEYGELTNTVLAGFDDEESDAIYAKALGYFDGLMFGIPADNDMMVNERLQEFVGSTACGLNRTVSLSL